MFRLLILTLFIFTACESEYYPKEKGHLRLEYPIAKYGSFEKSSLYKFQKSIYATTENQKKENWYNLNYKGLKATLYLSYYPVNKNLKKLLKDVEKLTFNHSIKATAIEAIPYENIEKKVYAKLFRVGGESASNIQFYATDSTKNLLAGSIYFYTSPQADSLQPAINYLEKDMMKIIETLEWK